MIYNKKFIKETGFQFYKQILEAMELNQESIINQIKEEHKSHHEKVINCTKCYPLLHQQSWQEYVEFWN